MPDLIGLTMFNTMFNTSVLQRVGNKYIRKLLLANFNEYENIGLP
jgi:hypothetical protein